MKLCVGNLPKTVTARQLRELAAPYGKLVSATIVEDGAGGSKGLGFIEYSSVREAENAMSGLDGRAIDGHSLRVERHRADEPLQR